MKTKIFTFLLIASFIFVNAQEIPSFTFNQTFNYPEGPQDGSDGSVLSPAAMIWNDYSQQYLITYVPVTSANTIYIGSTEAALFKIFVPPYVTKISISFNGQAAATQYCRVSTIELATTDPTPTNYVAGTFTDSDWRWKGVGDRTFPVTRNSNFFTTGSYVYYAFYNGANIDNDYDGVPEGDLQSDYDLGSFNVSWGINSTDSTDYYNWAHGITNITNISENNYTVFPNPATEHITIKNVSNENVQVLDITGKTIYNSVSNENDLTISLEKFQTGIYFVKVGASIQKFVKK